MRAVFAGRYRTAGLAGTNLGRSPARSTPPWAPRSAAGVPGGRVTAAAPVPLAAVVALPVVRLLEVLLPPQPENASVTRTVATATGPSFIASIIGPGTLHRC